MANNGVSPSRPALNGLRAASAISPSGKSGMGETQVDQHRLGRPQSSDAVWHAHSAYPTTARTQHGSNDAPQTVPHRPATRNEFADTRTSTGAAVGMTFGAGGRVGDGVSSVEEGHDGERERGQEHGTVHATQTSDTRPLSAPKSNTKPIRLYQWSIAFRPCKDASIFSPHARSLTHWIQVAGVRYQGEEGSSDDRGPSSGGEFWHTSLISEAVTPLLVKTHSGGLYELIGCCNEDAMRTKHGLARETIADFKEGFPQGWDAAVAAEARRQGLIANVPNAQSSLKRDDPLAQLSKATKPTKVPPLSPKLGARVSDKTVRGQVSGKKLPDPKQDPRPKKRKKMHPADDDDDEDSEWHPDTPSDAISKGRTALKDVSSYDCDDPHFQPGKTESTDDDGHDANEKENSTNINARGREVGMKSKRRARDISPKASEEPSEHGSEYESENKFETDTTTTRRRANSKRRTKDAKLRRAKRSSAESETSEDEGGGGISRSRKQAIARPRVRRSTLSRELLTLSSSGFGHRLIAVENAILEGLEDIRTTKKNHARHSMPTHSHRGDPHTPVGQIGRHAAATPRSSGRKRTSMSRWWEVPTPVFQQQQQLLISTDTSDDLRLRGRRRRPRSMSNERSNSDEDSHRLMKNRDSAIATDTASSSGQRGRLAHRPTMLRKTAMGEQNDSDDDELENGVAFAGEKKGLPKQARARHGERMADLSFNAEDQAEKQDDLLVLDIDEEAWIQEKQDDQGEAEDLAEKDGMPVENRTNGEREEEGEGEGEETSAEPEVAETIKMEDRGVQAGESTNREDSSDSTEEEDWYGSAEMQGQEKEQASHFEKDETTKMTFDAPQAASLQARQSAPVAVREPENERAVVQADNAQATIPKEKYESVLVALRQLHNSEQPASKGSRVDEAGDEGSATSSLDGRAVNAISVKDAKAFEDSTGSFETTVVDVEMQTMSASPSRSPSPLLRDFLASDLTLPATETNTEEDPVVLDAQVASPLSVDKLSSDHNSGSQSNPPVSGHVPPVVHSPYHPPDAQLCAEDNHRVPLSSTSLFFNTLDDDDEPFFDTVQAEDATSCAEDVIEKSIGAISIDDNTYDEKMAASKKVPIDDDNSSEASLGDAYDDEDEDEVASSVSLGDFYYFSD